MNLKLQLLLVSSILLSVYTVSARPSQRGIEVLRRLQLPSDEVKKRQFIRFWLQRYENVAKFPAKISNIFIHYIMLDEPTNVIVIRLVYVTNCAWHGLPVVIYYAHAPPMAQFSERRGSMRL